MIKSPETSNETLYVSEPLTESQKTYLNAWLLMKVSAENSVTFLGKKRLVREWENYAKTFGLLDFESLSSAEQSALKENWRQFFTVYCDLCLNDPTYGSMLFGLIKAKDASVKEKIAYELNRILCLFPDKLGLIDLFVPLQEIAEEVYYSVVK